VVVSLAVLTPSSSSAQTDCPNEFTEDFEPESAPEWTVDTAVNLNSDSPNWTLTDDPAAHSATHSFMSDASGLDLKDDRLIAPPVDLSRTSRLTFWHRFSFESGYDGGLLEVSTDGGNRWVNVVRVLGQFTEGGYNGVIDGESGSPIAHEPVWTGDSPDPTAMTRVAVDIGDPVGGGPYLLRWRLVLDPRADRSSPGTGWWIDDVHISDLGIDCPPIAADDFAITAKDRPIAINVLANDSDIDSGEPLSVSGVTSPQHGEAAITGISEVTYSPEGEFEGQDSFSYTVCDHPQGGSQCSSANVFVTVGGEMQLLSDPRCSEPGLTILSDGIGDALMMEPSHDIERIALLEPPTLGTGKIVFILKVVSLPTTLPSNTTWSIVFGQPGFERFLRMTTSSTGTPIFSYGSGTNPNPFMNPGTPADPASNFTTDGTIRMVVRGSLFGYQEGTAIARFVGRVQTHAGSLSVPIDSVPNDQVPSGSYTVIGNDNCVVNVTPFAVDDAPTAITGFPTRLNVLANDADADGDPLGVTGATDPPNGTATVNADNTVTYRSTCGFSGSDTFTYSVSDGQGGSDSALVTVRVRKTSRRGSIC
jgi:hypothetical protein